jgi:DNA-binding NtrC family response regulator
MVRVLVIDDEPSVLQSAKLLLGSAGYSVIVASNLAQGLREAKGSRFDILWTDKNIGRHRGLVPLLDYMESEKVGVPVVISSGEDGWQAVKELYCHAFHRKGGYRMLTVIEEVLAQQPTPDKPIMYN